MFVGRGAGDLDLVLVSMGRVCIGRIWRIFMQESADGCDVRLLKPQIWQSRKLGERRLGGCRRGIGCVGQRLPRRNVVFVSDVARGISMRTTLFRHSACGEDGSARVVRMEEVMEAGAIASDGESMRGAAPILEKVEESASVTSTAKSRPRLSLTAKPCAQQAKAKTQRRTDASRLLNVMRSTSSTGSVIRKACRGSDALSAR